MDYIVKQDGAPSCKRTITFDESTAQLDVRGRQAVVLNITPGQVSALVRDDVNLDIFLSDEQLLRLQGYFVTPAPDLFVSDGGRLFKLSLQLRYDDIEASFSRILVSGGQHADMVFGAPDASGDDAADHEQLTSAAALVARIDSAVCDNGALTLMGEASADARVQVEIGDCTMVVHPDDRGNWSAVFEADALPDAGDYVPAVSVRAAGGHSVHLSAPAIRVKARGEGACLPADPADIDPDANVRFDAQGNETDDEITLVASGDGDARLRARATLITSLVRAVGGQPDVDAIEAVIQTADANPMTADLIKTAIETSGRTGRISTPDQPNWPAIALMTNGQAVLVERGDAETLTLRDDTQPGGQVDVPMADFRPVFSGQIVTADVPSVSVQPDEPAETAIGEAQAQVGARTADKATAVYVLGGLVVNLVALALVLFSVQALDRAIVHPSYPSVGVFILGTLVALSIDFGLIRLRSVLQTGVRPSEDGMRIAAAQRAVFAMIFAGAALYLSAGAGWAVLLVCLAGASLPVMWHHRARTADAPRSATPGLALSGPVLMRMACVIVIAVLCYVARDRFVSIGVVIAVGLSAARAIGLGAHIAWPLASRWPPDRAALRARLSRADRPADTDLPTKR